MIKLSMGQGKFGSVRLIKSATKVYAVKDLAKDYKLYDHSVTDAEIKKDLLDDFLKNLDEVAINYDLNKIGAAFCQRKPVEFAIQQGKKSVVSYPSIFVLMGYFQGVTFNKFVTNSVSSFVELTLATLLELQRVHRVVAHR